MSRIGKKPVKIPSGITVEVNGREIKVKGPKGELSYSHRPEINVKVDGDLVHFEIKRDTKEAPAFWGLSRALVSNMVQGVSEGFEKKLELVGVGYRVKAISDKQLSISVGYSNPVEFTASEGITFHVEGNQDITVKGIDKQLVGLTAAQIRKLRKPEPYKGKGIKYKDEVIRRKAGKSGKK